MKDEIQNFARAGRRLFVAAIFSSFILLPSSFVFADSIFVGTLERANVTIRDFKGATLQFDIAGRPSETDATRISKLVIPSEPQLTAAEQAFATEKWDEAVDAYQRLLRTAAKPWVKDWSGFRLAIAAGKSGRFDAAATAYVQMLIKDPVGAASVKPAMPDSKSTYLDTAITTTNTALADSKLTNDQKRALLGFLIEIQQAKKNPAGEDAAYEQLIKLPGADLNDPTAQRVLARRRIASAMQSLANKSYAKVIDEINSNRTLFIDPAQQSEALYLLAEARLGIAAADPSAMKDAALAYMRVVAQSNALSGKPFVLPALQKTAEIMEKIGEPKSAAALYSQIIDEFPNDPAAAKARTEIRRLSPN
jgi:TolA-binding protein